MRFYGIGYQQCLDLPFNYMMSLYREMYVIEAEEDARLLAVTHAGNPKQQMDELIRRIKREETQKKAAQEIITSEAGKLVAETTSANELAERLRQKAELDRQRKAERDAQRSRTNGVPST